MKVGIYSGSFDPVTLGHYDIIERASSLVDKLVIGVFHNSMKIPAFSVEERVEMLKEVTKDMENVEVEAFSGLVVDFAKMKGAKVIIRGLRTVTDFEYELQIARTNSNLSSDVETIFLTADMKCAYVSSSLVRELAMYGADISEYVPKCVASKICQKYKK